MDINFSPPVTRSTKRHDTEVLRSDHMDTSSANISVENVYNSPVAFESPSPMDFTSPVLLQTYEEAMTQTESDHSDTQSNINRASQTRIIIHPNSKLDSDLVELCDDVWPNENCLISKCAYSELNADFEVPNSDLFKCEICHTVLCKKCKIICHDFHYKSIKLLDDT